MHGIIHKIVFGYFNLYLFLFITIKSQMATAQKIVNNLINENIFPLKVIKIK